MTKQSKPVDKTKKEQPSKPCADDFHTKDGADGRNDSGPEPEVHGREIPPQ